MPCEGSSGKWEVWSVGGLWSLSLACEGRSVEVWSVKCEVWKGEVWSGQNSIVFCNCRIVLAICMGFQVVLVDDLPMEFSRKFRRKRVYFSLHFGASDFPFKNAFESASKSSIFRSGVEIRFWSYNFRRRCALFSVFCNSVSADRIGMAASRLLLASAACVMSFAAGSRKSFCSLCFALAAWRLRNGCVSRLSPFWR